MFGPAYPAFNPMRVLRTRVVAEHDATTGGPADRASRPPVGELVVGDERLVLHRFDFFPPTRASSGDLDQLPLLAGQGVGVIDDVPRAGELVEALVRDAVAVIRAFETSDA